MHACMQLCRTLLVARGVSVLPVPGTRDLHSCIFMLTDAPGRWEFRCNVQHHFNAGMKGVLAISPTDHQLDTLALPAY